MYQAKVLDYYISANAIFYRVNGKLDRAVILNKRRNQGESREEAENRWGSEQHWLADWGNTQPFEEYQPGCSVSFEVRSSTFYPVIYHGKKVLKRVRNLNVQNIKRLAESNVCDHKI